MTKKDGVTTGGITTANLSRHLRQAAINIPNLLAVAVQQSQRPAFSLATTLNYQEINFSDLHTQSDELAFALNHYGIKRGMKAVLMVTPSIDFFILTFALFKAGIVPILVDPGMGVKNLKQCFSESAPDVFIGIPKAHIARKFFSWGKNSVKFLLTVGGTRFFGASLLGGVGLEQLLKVADKADKPYPMVMLAEDEMAAILFTSGSTGIPKGVVYSHKMFEAQIRALKNDYGIVAGERDLATFPLFSLFGPALGMASIIPDMDASKPITANPDFIFAAIKKYQCSNLFANPALLEVLGQAANKLSQISRLADGEPYKVPSLKRVISAGAPATLSSIKCFGKILNTEIEVINSYGATEALPLTKIGSRALLATAEITANGGGICVGLPIKGVDIAIIAITDENIAHWHDELALPINTIGEIVAKGDMVSQAYYQRPNATAQAKMLNSVFTGEESHDVGIDYRHRMGDLGYLDENGLLWMCGRKAHRVETSEHILFSIPCERIFNTHKAVKRSALVGIKVQGVTSPLLCVELNQDVKINSKEAQQHLFDELKEIGALHQQSSSIIDFLIHPDFPVDIRHNAKIFREKLALWAQKQIEK